MVWKKVLLDGDVAGGSGTLVQKAYNNADLNITTTGDNQATINLSSVTGVGSISFEVLMKVLSAANAQINIIGNLESPGHTILETFQYRFDATGTGDIFGTTSLIVGVDTSPTTGNYHLNITTLTLGAGTVTVLMRRLMSVQS